nr:MAG TPA: hypothetical protein [Caudoviricetes sp.]
MFFDNSVLLPRVSLHSSTDGFRRDWTVSQTNTQRTGNLPTDLQSLNRPQKVSPFNFYPYGLSGLAADFTLLTPLAFGIGEPFCFF